MPAQTSVMRIDLALGNDIFSTSPLQSGPACRNRRQPQRADQDCSLPKYLGDKAGVKTKTFKDRERLKE